MFFKTRLVLVLLLVLCSILQGTQSTSRAFNASQAFTTALVKDSYQKDRQQVVRLSIQEHQKTISKQAATSQLKSKLTDFSKQEGLIASLKNFAIKALGLKPKTFTVIETNEKGYSGDRVYSIVDVKSLQTLAILKIFKMDSSHLFSEVFSLHILKKADIPQFFSPQILAVGRCHVDKKHYFLPCESTAPGSSLLHHYRERLDFEDLKIAIRSCGISLAKLHSHNTGISPTLPDALKAVTKLYFSQAINKLQTYPQEDIDIQKLTKLFEESLTKIEATPLRTGITHGDTKLSNVFFDPISKTVTWIDPPTLSESIDSSGYPIGIPAKDYYSFISDIEYQRLWIGLDEKGEVCTQELLKENQIQELKAIFANAYQDAGGELPTKEQLDFFELASIAYFISKDPHRCYPEPMKSSKLRRMTTIYKNLKTRLSKST